MWMCLIILCHSIEYMHINSIYKQISATLIVDKQISGDVRFVHFKKNRKYAL